MNLKKLIISALMLFALQVSAEDWISAGKASNGGEFFVDKDSISGSRADRSFLVKRNNPNQPSAPKSFRFKYLMNCDTKMYTLVIGEAYAELDLLGNKIDNTQFNNLSVAVPIKDGSFAERYQKVACEESAVSTYKAPKNKSRTQILKEYKFKWKNGNEFSMSDVGEMMIKCAGYSISLYELQPRQSILQKRGGKEFLAKVDTVRADQIDIVTKLYGQNAADQMLSRAATLMSMMIRNPGGIESNSKEATDCFDMTKTAREMMDGHYKKLTPLN